MNYEPTSLLFFNFYHYQWYYFGIICIKKMRIEKLTPASRTTTVLNRKTNSKENRTTKTKNFKYEFVLSTI